MPPPNILASDSLMNTERNLDLAKGHVNRADDNTTDIKTLNRSIFIPAITFNKEKKRREQEAKLTARYESERAEHERLQTERSEVHQRIGGATTNGLHSFNRDGPPGDDDEGTGGRPGAGRSGSQQQAERKKQWGRYQFEATASDDEAENEIDNNLDELGDAVGRLKALAVASGQEVERQNKVLGRLQSKTDNVDRRVRATTDRVSGPSEHLIIQ
jgi:protein transport protein SEC9